MTTQLEPISLNQSAEAVARQLGDSFREFGFSIVTDHGIPDALIEKGWKLSKAFFALPESEKQSYAIKDSGGQRGYTPFGTEIAKGAEKHDLKEFWHVGRPGADLPDGMPQNIWPDTPDNFRETFEALYTAFDQAGGRILSALALYLDLDPSWFDTVVDKGNSILRLLHYPPVENAGGAIRAGAHEDINLITLLLGAEEAGLELLGKNEEWIEISPPRGAMIVNIGDMLQRLSNHVLPSTTHRVRNPDDARSSMSRYSMPFFLHPNSDFLIETLSRCQGPDRPNRYPEPITADAYLQIRLKEIGLIN